jgi:hypothetical protein
MKAGAFPKPVNQVNPVQIPKTKKRDPLPGRAFCEAINYRRPQVYLPFFDSPGR